MLGGPNKSLRWPGWGTGHWLWGGGGGYEYFQLCYVLIDCNVTGLVSCSDILGSLVRSLFIRLPFYHLKNSLNVT